MDDTSPRPVPTGNPTASADADPAAPRVLVALTPGLVRVGVEAAITASGGYELVVIDDDADQIGSTMDGTSRVDVLVSSIETCLRRLDARAPGEPPPPAAAAITGDVEPAQLLTALRAGCHAVLLETAGQHDLVYALRCVLDGGLFIDPGLVRHLVDEASKGHRGGEGPFGLTTQERRVIERMAQGASNPEIGEALGISRETVKTHLSTAFQKLGAYDRIHATRIARQNGLVWDV